MKKYLFVLLATGMIAACNSADKKTESAATTESATAGSGVGSVIKFEEESFDFGKVTDGEKVTHAFKFTNNGESPLIISNAVASCGCTTPEWPKSPVLPGKTGEVSVTFNSAGKQGLQDKLITITANTNPAQNVVHLVGEVLTKK